MTNESEDITKVTQEEVTEEKTNTTDWKSVFKQHIDNNIQAEDLREFAREMATHLPAYFYQVAASTSGKYHPESDLGEGGLVRHSINVLTILNHMMSIESCKFTDREKDLLRIGALFHDGIKCGTVTITSKNEHTVHTHPMLAANFVIAQSTACGVDYQDARFIADAIISHMGQWNTSKYEPGILPKPKTEAQLILHMADYLASRKDLVYKW